MTIKKYSPSLLYFENKTWTSINTLRKEAKEWLEMLWESGIDDEFTFMHVLEGLKYIVNRTSTEIIEIQKGIEQLNKESETDNDGE